MTSMTAPPDTANPSKTPVAFFGGIDTHKSTHHVAIVDATGRPITDREFQTTPAGYAEIVAFFHAHNTVDESGSRAPAPTAPE